MPEIPQNSNPDATEPTAFQQALELPGITVLEPLATGGSGIVYKAWDEVREMLVAVKVIERRMFDDEHTLRRFLREVRLQGGLKHPSILPLHDAGFLETHPYIVTEFAPGGSLRERISSTAELPLPFVWRIGAEVAAGLEHAHAAGVVHRDLKPENILLGDKEQALIADFGLAVALPRAHSLLTQAGTLLGTPNYIAPELLLRGKPTPAVDVYALGVILFELLAGGPPFAGADLVELLHEKVHGQPPPLEMLRPEVPQAGRELVLACLEKKPARRPTASAVASRVAKLAAGVA
jgi:serine/threonine-protein kinase